MYKLYFAPGSAAMAPHAMLEEIGAPFELVKVDTRPASSAAPTISGSIRTLACRRSSMTASK